jgi:hypothetical protein
MTAPTVKYLQPEVSHRSVRRNSLYLAGGVLLVAICGLGYWIFLSGQRRADHVASIAVIPFVNDSGDAEVDYLSDGLTELLINDLSQLKGPSVKGPSLVSRYKGKQVLPQQIGSELGVQALLNGRVTQSAIIWS